MRRSLLKPRSTWNRLEPPLSGHPSDTAPHRAGRLALSIMGRRAKLNGLDAPTKIAPTDPTGEHQADTGAIDVSILSEDTLRRVLREMPNEAAE